MSQNDCNSLIGIWKLKSIQFEFADTGEIADVFGPNPSGYLIHTGEGRMMAILTRSDRAPPTEDSDGSALFKTMMAYTGIFRVEGDDKFITHVDLAWHPGWNGTEQTRFFKVEGNTLSITTVQQTHPMFPGRMGPRRYCLDKGLILVRIDAWRTEYWLGKSQVRRETGGR